MPLDKELKMISDYLALETIRYDNGLDISVQLPKVTSHMIAPLMLLPFIENAFKHGASQMAEAPWISLAITVIDDKLEMKLINGKPIVNLNKNEGIGIVNVRKRLEILYPDRHMLTINDEEEMYIVNLSLELLSMNPGLIKPVYD